jgi:hypothetical protein
VPHCPNCQSTRLRRSATRSRWERWRKEITGKRPYRCCECNWRGWKQTNFVEHAAPSRDPRMNPPEPPNLRGTMLARPNPRLSLDLKELDAFHQRTNDPA